MKQKEKQTVLHLSVIEIAKQIAEDKEKLALLIRSRYTKPSKNVREAKAIRLRIAYLSTVKHMKELNS